MGLFNIDYIPGADAIVNARYGSAGMMQGAAEVLAYGTAVRII